MRIAVVALLLLALGLVPPTAQAHLLEQGRSCSAGTVPLYTSPGWVQAWASDPIDEGNLTSDPAGHGLNSVGRVDDPCIEVRWPCQLRVYDNCLLQ